MYSVAARSDRTIGEARIILESRQRPFGDAADDEGVGHRASEIQTRKDFRRDRDNFDAGRSAATASSIDRTRIFANWRLRFAANRSRTVHFAIHIVRSRFIGGARSGRHAYSVRRA